MTMSGVLLARSKKTLHAGRRICGCCIRRFDAQMTGSAQIGVLEISTIAATSLYLYRLDNARLILLCLLWSVMPPILTAVSWRSPLTNETAALGLKALAVPT